MEARATAAHHLRGTGHVHLSHLIQAALLFRLKDLPQGLKMTGMRYDQFHLRYLNASRVRDSQKPQVLQTLVQRFHCSMQPSSFRLSR